MSKDTDKRTRPVKKSRPIKTHYVSPDGKARTPALERKLNECFAIIFRGAAGEEVRNYLRSISTNQVMGPGTPTDTIVYHEGARWLMGIIDTRINHGEEKKP